MFLILHSVYFPYLYIYSSLFTPNLPSSSSLIAIRAITTFTKLILSIIMREICLKNLFHTSTFLLPSAFDFQHSLITFLKDAGTSAGISGLSPILIKEFMN